MSLRDRSCWRQKRRCQTVSQVKKAPDRRVEVHHERKGHEMTGRPNPMETDMAGKGGQNWSVLFLYVGRSVHTYELAMFKVNTRLWRKPMTPGVALRAGVCRPSSRLSLRPLRLDLLQIRMQLRLAFHDPLHDLLDHLLPILCHGRIELGELLFGGGVDGRLGGRGFRFVL